MAVTRVREHIDNHFAEPIRLGALADLVGLSPFYLLRLFKRVTGQTPHSYLQQIRVTRAREMIAAGMSISQAAFSSGFADQSHFTRNFKSAYSTTPARYLRALGAG